MSVDPSRYADLFRTESREQLAAINRALLALEGGEHAAEPVRALFRALHSMKGMSATMGYHAVASFAHEVESVLDRVRRGEQAVERELIDVLFASADALESGLEDTSETAEWTDAMRAAVQRLHDVAGGGATSEYAVVTAVAGSAPEGAPGAVKGDPIAGPGTVVRVRQSADAVLPGVRAFLVVERLRALGEVAGTSPPLAQLKEAETPQAFAVRLITQATATEIEATVRLAGEVERVDIDVSGRRRQSHTSVASLSDDPGSARSVTRPTRHVRMELTRLDTLMNLVGELVIIRGRLLQLTATYGEAALDETMQQAARLISELQGEILTSRMVPVWQVFDRFPRMVRDAARQLGKEVNFVVEGKDIELDRSLLDEIGEPLVHLLRNAVDHGIEPPEARVAVGKPRAGRLVLSAQRDRSAVLIRVSDDGRGIDRDRVLTRAKALGLVDAATVDIDDDTLFRCIATPGFSTAESLSGISGRGVGIDAVRARTRSLGGSMDLRTTEGEGTSVTIRVPVTLAIIRAILARSGAERYALPLTLVRETLEFGEQSVQRVKGREMLVLRDEVMPLLHLREVVRQGGEVGQEREVVIIELGDRRSGLVVDELLGQQDIVVKPFDAARDGLALFSGATILSDGAPALIMDVGSLFGGT
jgi:two-component system chemotaxis sensor kinase CheA